MGKMLVARVLRFWRQMGKLSRQMGKVGRQMGKMAARGLARSGRHVAMLAVWRWVGPREAAIAFASPRKPPSEGLISFGGIIIKIISPRRSR